MCRANINVTLESEIGNDYKRMKVIDKVKVVGRGCVIVVVPDCEINISDKIVFGDNEFEIGGIERLSFMKKTGLVLRPNDVVYEKINIGDEIELAK